MCLLTFPFGEVGEPLVDIVGALSFSLLLLAGVSIAHVVGSRSVLFSFPLGLAITTISSTALGVVGLFANIPTSANPAFWFAGVTVAFVSFAKRRDAKLWLSYLLGITAVVGSVGLKGLLGIGEWATSDSAQVLELATQWLQRGDLASSTSRGLTPLLMVSSHPGSQLLTLFFPVVFFAIVSLTFYIWHRSFGVTEKYLFNDWPLGLTWLLLLTTPIMQANIFYVGPHTLTALGLGLMIPIILNPRTRGNNTKSYQLGFAVGAILLALSRPEGPVIVALILVFASLRAVPEDKTMTQLISLTGVLGTTAALAELSLPGLERLGTFDSAVTASLLPVLAAIFVTMTKRYSHVLLIGWAILPYALGVAVLGLAVNGTSGLLAYIANTFFGAGRWGAIFPLLLALFLLFAKWRSQSPLGLLYRIPLPIVFSFLILKAISDGAFARIGPADSINRMLVHLVPIFALLLADLIRKTFSSRTRFVLTRSNG